MELSCATEKVDIWGRLSSYPDAVDSAILAWSRLRARNRKREMMIAKFMGKPGTFMSLTTCVEDYIIIKTQA